MSLDKNEVLAMHEAFYRAFEKRDLQAMNLVWWQGAGSLCFLDRIDDSLANKPIQMT